MVPLALCYAHVRRGVVLGTYLVDVQPAVHLVSMDWSHYGNLFERVAAMAFSCAMRQSCAVS